MTFKDLTNSEKSLRSLFKAPSSTLPKLTRLKAYMAEDRLYPRRWWILILLTTSFFATYSATTPVWGPILPSVISELKITRIEAGLIFTVFSIAQMLTILPSGAVVDRFGVKKLYGTITIAVGLTIFAIGLAGSYTPLLAIMFVVGLLYPLQFVLRSKATMEWFSRKERATANSIVISCLSLAPFVYTPLVTYLLEVVRFRWGSIFYLVGAITLATGFVLLLLYRDPPSNPTPVSRNSSTTQSTLTAFKRLITNRDILFCHTGFAVTVGVFQTTATWGMSFLREQIGLEPMVAASVMMAWSLAGTFRWAGGLLSDRIAHGRRKLTCAPAVFLESIACVSLATLTSQTPLLLVATLFLAVGLMRAMWGGPGNIWGIEIAPRELIASAAALQGLLSLIASSLFPFLVGWVLDVTGSFFYVWIVVGVIEGAVATPLWLMVRDVKTEEARSS